MSETKQTTNRLSDQLWDTANCASAARREFAEQSLQNLEQTVDSIIEFERKIAEAIPVDWIREVMVVRTAVVNEAKTAYVRAARTVLNPATRQSTVHGGGGPR
jgi:hypothetical protein